MTLRYTLVNQLHYLGEVAGEPALVTLQRWDARRAASRRSDLVILNDGVPVLERRCIAVADLAHMDAMFTETAKLYAGQFLTEDQARDLIAERTGTRPADRYCSRRHCPSAVPLGADRCEEGHPFGSAGTGAGYAPPAGREIMLRTGGAR